MTIQSEQDDLVTLREIKDHNALDYLIKRLKEKGVARGAFNVLVQAIIDKAKGNLEGEFAINTITINTVISSKELLDLINQDLLDLLK